MKVGDEVFIAQNQCNSFRDRSTQPDSRHVPTSGYVGSGRPVQVTDYLLGGSEVATCAKKFCLSRSNGKNQTVVAC